MISVSVTWRNGCVETFECLEVRQGTYILLIRLTDGQYKVISLAQTRTQNNVNNAIEVTINWSSPK